MRDMEDLTRLISEIARDRESGASEILERGIRVLLGVMPLPKDERLRIARALCAAQPGMASLWNAALAALSDGPPERFERFVQRVRRAPDALARFVRELFPESGARPGGTRAPLSLVTASYSGSVLRSLTELAGDRRLRVACAEGRPALEGRRMAGMLAQAGAAVTLLADAAIADAVPGADAVIVGADAVASEWFLNKIGTRMLAAAGALLGVPMYVVASRDKFCAPALASFIVPLDGPSDEIWDAPPSGVIVRNPYFERVPIDLVTAVITDAGIMPAANVAQFCASLESAAAAGLVKELAVR